MFEFQRRKRKALSREASLEMAKARKRARDLSPPRESIDVFVLRRAPNENVFLWQIRLFGGMTLATSPVSFPSFEAAKEDGLAAHVSYCGKIDVEATTCGQVMSLGGLSGLSAETHGQSQGIQSAFSVSKSIHIGKYM